MRVGQEILSKCIGKKLQNGAIQSYLFNSEVVDELNLIFLKFGGDWIALDTTDGMAVHLRTEEPKYDANSFDLNDVKYNYPILQMEDQYSNFSEYIGKVLVKYSELIDISSKDICGLKFFFNDNSSITIYSDKTERTFLNFNEELPVNIKETTKREMG